MDGDMRVSQDGGGRAGMDTAVARSVFSERMRELWARFLGWGILVIGLVVLALLPFIMMFTFSQRIPLY
ncbi:hypothetical protein ACQZV8_03120 [Magnetococcales bacterium HHB-1]